MKTYPASVSHHEWEIKELRANRELALEYIKQAVESLEHRGERVGGILALSSLREAFGDTHTLATEAGVDGNQLYQMLVSVDIPMLDTEDEYEHWFEQQAQARSCVNSSS